MKIEITEVQICDEAGLYATVSMIDDRVADIELGSMGKSQTADSWLELAEKVSEAIELMFPPESSIMSDDIAQLQADCFHDRIATYRYGNGSSAGLWGCVECSRKFVPLDLDLEKDAKRFRWLISHLPSGTLGDAEVHDAASWAEAIDARLEELGL